MKARLMNTHLVVPRLRSFAKVKIKKEVTLSKIGFFLRGSSVSQTRLVIPSQNECFVGVIPESACLSVCPSVYKILVSVKALVGVLSHI